ncbi:MAG: RNase adapter RapZ [Thermodesulfobacteriota bacterium]
MKETGADATGIRLFSFGFKHGMAEADMVLDVRFLPNPYWVPELSGGTGRDPAVAAYVLANPAADEFFSRLLPLLIWLIPRYLAEGKRAFTLAVGCTGGQHRSVAVVEKIAAELRQVGMSAAVVHRDLGENGREAAVDGGRRPVAMQSTERT